MFLPSAQPEDVGLSSERLERIDRLLREATDRGELPGAATLIARHGRQVHLSVCGFKTIASQEPLTPDTIFAIFSMTKPITAVAMMILYDQGLWSPDDPIAKHLPEFAEVRGPGNLALDHPPTMRQLMTHTAGFGYAIGLGPHDATDQAYIEAGVWAADDLADFSRRVASVDLAYLPGSRWRYSLSMDLQGAVIERLTGRTLPDVMRAGIFEPLGMEDTDFYVEEAKQARLATLYHMYGTDELTVLDHPAFRRDGLRIPKLASGGAGLFSTLGDYARFAQMLLGKGELDGARIISAEAAELMMRNHLPEPITAAGVLAGAQKIGPGRGYGFNGAVIYDPALAGSPVGRGSYQWDGASGVWFWIDPENDLLFVGMIQRMMQENMPPFQALTQGLIAEALQD